jgi:hypothetical protein
MPCRNELPQRLGAHDGESGHQRGFCRVGGWHHKRLGLLGLCLAGDGQNAAAGPQTSIQAQFSCAAQPLQFLGIKLTAGDEQGQRDREIEGGSFLASIRWCQIDDDPRKPLLRSAARTRSRDS